MPNGIEHVFVLMMENRSFDHMCGFSALTGTDAETGKPNASIWGLTGNETNSFRGKDYKVQRGANNRMPDDPIHEFEDVVGQLCGPGTHYNGGAYPAIRNSGFAASYGDRYCDDPRAQPDDVMKCYDTTTQLPVLYELMKEFVVCDNWRSSMPGPTWPNRMFVHAGSSGGLDHSPTLGEIVEWELLHGFHFKNGTVFDAIAAKKGLKRRLYAGDDFPMVAALRGIGLGDVRSYGKFHDDLKKPGFDYNYIFIEPHYDVLNKYKKGTSQHPLGDVTMGEALIRATYESIRGSDYWENSLLIVTWDEHGGFYDGGEFPESAVAPGDTRPHSHHNRTGFTFEQYGARVPAIVISPKIPKNLIDHRLYDHSSIPATLRGIFGIRSLTQRDAAANRLDPLLSLERARTDAPERLQPPAPGRVPAEVELTLLPESVMEVSDPESTVDDGNLPGILHSALRQDLEASAPEQREAILARVGAIRTRAEASQYMEEVRRKILPLR